MGIFDRRVLADRRMMALQSRRHARRRLCAAELLEPRRVLAGNISGTAYEDLDNDNVVDSGEGLSGWTVYADSNNNAVRDTSEPQSVSGSSGSYYLSGVTAGSAVVVRAIAPAGWQTVDASRTLALVNNEPVSGFNLRGALGDGVALLSGAIWHDVNGNGTRDSGETMNTSSTVYVDLDNDSVRDSNEPYAYASSTNGGTTLNYKLPVAQAGTYTVRQILYSPWQQVSPASNAGQSVTVTAGQRATVPDFIDRNPIATIYGTVFEDINGNALKEQGETLTLAGWRVYADLNDNGSPDSSEPSATTSSYGSYSLAVDTQGTLTSVAVRTVVPAGWAPTGDSNRRLVSSLKGGSFFSNGFFGNQTAGGLVSGLVWNDMNANGLSTGEGVVAGRTVYADMDGDAVLDADEPQATTLSDGRYQLLITTAGTFNVRQVVPTGWSQTSPAANAAQSVAVTLGTTGTPGSRITDRNFGVRSTSFTLSGTVFDDADSNGGRGSTEALLSGWRVFADLNDNGAFDTAEPSSVTSSSGAYSVVLASLTTSSTVKFRVEIQAGWQATSPNPALRTFTVAPGGSVPNQSFGVKVQGRGIGGVVWNDADSDGVKGGSETALISWMVYLDANNNGVRDSTEASTSTGSDGSYVLPVPAAGDYTVRVMPMTNCVPTSPSNGVRTVTVGSTRVSGMDFGYRSTQAYVSGTVFDDANANGSVDLGEAGLAGWRVFADLNDNGLQDGGEPMATSSSSGAYSLSVIASTGSVTTKVRTQAATGWLATSPAGWVQTVTATVGQTASGRNFGSRPGGSLVSGFAWNDTDGDAVVDAGEYGPSGWTIFADANNNAILDAGESRTTTFSGAYQLVVPTAGSYTIRPVADSYWLSTAPAGGSYAVTVGSADRLTARDFGRQAAIGFVSGTVFNDADGSGGMNGAETGLGGWRVFIDANGNGLLDSTEPSTTTSSSGGYFMSMTFSAQTVTATVRTQIQPGWLATSPVAGSQSVTITRGQTTSGRSFGVRNDSSVAVISGIAFNDANGNGVRETSDWPLSGRTIYVDADGDATLDADEIRTTTGTDGSYRIAFTSAGAYTLRQVLPSGFAQTTPASDAGIAVTVAVGDRAGGKDFGSRSALGSIAGFVFNDANANGTQDAGEAGLPSWRVYVDVDGDDTWDTNEPSSLTSSSGSYYLNSVVATQTPAAVRTVIPTGWAATLPSAGEQAVTIVPGSTVSGRNFGNRSTVAAATGTVWNDTDADGVRDVGETAVSSRAIYVDANGNGAMDAEELRTYSAFDGTYRLTLPGAGTFTIRQLLPADWLQTSPAAGAGRTVVIAAVGDTSAGNDFASRFTRAQITGFVFNDVNSNGIVDTGEGTPNARVYADLDGDAAWDANEPSMVTSSSGTYWLMVSAIDPNDAAALSRSISVRTILPVGWGLVTPSTGTRSVTVTGGQTVTGQNFTTTLVGASVSGMAWNDANGDGSKGSSEAGLSQLTVYVDGNDNGALDWNETRITTGADGTYRLFVPTAGSYVIRQVASSAWVPTAPLPNAHSLTVVGGELFTGRDFGNRAAFGTVSGVVYDDADQSGSRGTAEAGLAGWRIYADLDDDGVADATEPSTTTSSTGSYVLQISTIDSRVRTIKLRTVAQAGWGATTPADGALAAVQVTGGQQTTAQDFGVRLTGAIVGGTVWNDLNGNGTRDSGDTAIPGRTVYADLDGDSVLDSNEPRAWTASDGNYQLVFNAVGTYTIRQMLPYYWVQTSPSGGHSVTVESLGTRTTGRDFGSRNTVASVSGAVFEDLNDDGIRDAGEVGLSGVRVYADTNNDGAFTTGEPSFVTSSTGSYYLTVPNLPSSATISIRQAAFAGLAATLPAAGTRSLQIGGGQTTSGVNFGNRLTGAIVTGTVWHDLDSDGVRESGETSASGRTVYVDTNDNGLLDTSEARTTTLQDGSYQLMLTTAGTVKIRTVLPTGWQATLPALAAQTVAVTLGNRFVGNDFGTRLTTGMITGLVFNDLNGSGTQGAGESGLGGWIVFVDANNNGVWDTNEVRATTSSTGTYVLYGVTEGSTRVRLQLQVGWSFTTPGDGLLSPNVVASTTTKAAAFGVRTTPAA